MNKQSRGPIRVRQWRRYSKIVLLTLEGVCFSCDAPVLGFACLLASFVVCGTSYFSPARKETLTKVMPKDCHKKFTGLSRVESWRRSKNEGSRNAALYQVCVNGNTR